MLWTACHRLCKDEKSPRFRLVAVALVTFACLGGMLPFGKLVNLLYPYMGYLSLIPGFLRCCSAAPPKKQASPSPAIAPEPMLLPAFLAEKPLKQLCRLKY